MKVKIDSHGFVYIQRGIIWRPQFCKHSPRAQEMCRDVCPLLHEYEGNKLHFLCSQSPVFPTHEITEDDRPRRKKEYDPIHQTTLRGVPEDQEKEGSPIYITLDNMEIKILKIFAKYYPFSYEEIRMAYIQQLKSFDKTLNVIKTSLSSGKSILI